MNPDELSIGQIININPFSCHPIIVGKVCSIDDGTFTVDCSDDEYADGEEFFITFPYHSNEDISGSYEIEAY